MDIQTVEHIDPQAWDRYVLAHPHSSFFHRPTWARAVQQAYGHAPVHLAAADAGRLVGILPLMRVQSPLAGRALVSLPYATYGGILADDSDISRALLTAAQQLARDQRADYIELRHRLPSGLDLPEFGRYDTFRRELPEQSEDVLAWLPKKARAEARKAAATLTAETGPHLLETVYALYARTLRRLGSPNYRLELFRRLRDAYGDDCLCLLIRRDVEPLAGVVSFIFRDEITPYFSGSTDAGRHLSASNLMYLRLMEHAVRRGLRWFDFNRTRRDNAGPHDFKRHHGFQPTPLHYQVSLARSQHRPEMSPSSRRFAAARQLWRRLPLWVTRPAGAYVTKWIP